MVSAVITPSVWVRRVTSVRAAAFGPVGKLADGREHPVPGQWANVRVVVQDARDRLVRYPSQPGHVGHNRRPWTSCRPRRTVSPGSRPPHPVTTPLSCLPLPRAPRGSAVSRGRR